MMRAELRARTTAVLARLIRAPRDWSELVRGEGRIDSGEQGGLLAFSPPEFLGVSQSTRLFFSAWHPLSRNDLLLPGDRRRLVRALSSTRCAGTVFSGFDDGYGDVISALRAERPERPIYVLWHASTMQLAELEVRRHFETIVALGRRGAITRVGTFETAQAQTLRRLGVEAFDVFNPPPAGAPDLAASDAGSMDAGPLRLGLFLAGPSWRKNPYAMLEAAAQLGDVALTGVLDPDARRFADSLELDTTGVAAFPFGREALARSAGRQHCNLYVGLSECSPLFPLESLHWGVPCLIGSASHLFVRSPVAETAGSDRPEIERAAAVLEDLLVVDRPDDPSAIATAVERAIDARDEILAAYRLWHGAYREAAWRSMEALLGRPLERGDEA